MRIITSLFLTSILICCMCSTLRLCEAKLQGNETDRLALLAFKSQITHDPYNFMSSWNHSNHFCNWEGIACSGRHPRVTVMDLDSKGLVGPISPHLGNLSFLRTLILLNNSFHSEIPPELGKLFRLKFLILRSNRLVGKIPANISQCSNLKFLYLSHNNLDGKIPMELGSLPKLVNMSLERTKLTGEIPSSFGNLTSLEALGLRDNGLSGSIPRSLDQLKKLKILSISENNLTGTIPPTLYNHSMLEVFSIVENHFTGNLPTGNGLSLPSLKLFYVGANDLSGSIPNSLFNSSRLIGISMPCNHFTGEVPRSVENLIELQFLHLQENNLGTAKLGDLDFFTSLTNCTNLQDIVIYSNQFGGMLPASIGNFSNQISRLYLSGNKISGNIPPEIGNLQSLILLDLSQNYFTGSIPPGFQNLYNLEILFLGYNQLSGHVPSLFRNMSRLFELQLSNNILEGSILPTMESRMLKTLDLSFNNFTGTIPKEIGLSTHLSELNLTHNSLEGSIPIEIGNLKNLFSMTVSVNKLSGEIPRALQNCLSLTYLYLEGNSFQGSLPSSLSSLKGLVSFDVSLNNLSGNIPKELVKLSFLTLLNLSFNNFDGKVPTEGVFKNASTFSVIGNHNLCGGIPNLGLHNCHIQRPKRRQLGLAVKVAISVVISSFLITVFLVVYWRKKTEKKSPSEQEQCLVDLKRVSYNDLHKATDVFSPTNLIGKGSYGSVYKGVVPQGESPVAVKVLNLMEHGASKSFMAECEALKAACHRNLLRILTVCSSVDFDGNEFKAFVFKFMVNGSLESWLHPIPSDQHLRSLNLSERLNIMIDVACALDYLHNDCDIPIIHCDLKPSNVLLSNDMTAYVADFGVSKFLSDDKSVTSTMRTNESSSVSVRGTIGYIPPEYATGTNVSTQGDVYSYGILLLEMFTGKRPTDDMSKDGLSLPKYSKLALPDKVMDIIDERLLSVETPNGDVEAINPMKECLSSVIRIGISCSVDSTSQRMDIKTVIRELDSIKKNTIS